MQPIQQPTARGEQVRVPVDQHVAGDEMAGEPSAGEKWGMMVKQAKSGDLRQERPSGYWKFNHTGMVFIPAKSNSGSQSAL